MAGAGTTVAADDRRAGSPFAGRRGRRDGHPAADAATGAGAGAGAGMVAGAAVEHERDARAEQRAEPTSGMPAAQSGSAAPTAAQSGSAAPPAESESVHPGVTEAAPTEAPGNVPAAGPEEGVASEPNRTDREA